MSQMPDGQAGYESGAERAGSIAAVSIAALVSLFFLVKALRDEGRGRRLADLSIFAGLLVFVQIELVTGWSASRHRAGLTAVGAFRIAFALGGLCCAILALSHRKPAEVGLVRPVIGILLTAFHGLVGLALFLIPAVHSAPAPEEAWTYRSEKEDLSVTLPSREWVQGRMKDTVAAFRNRSRAVNAGILLIGGGRAEFHRQVSEFKSRELPALKDATVTEATTASGHSYFLAETSEKRPEGGEILITTGYFFREAKDQTVLFIVEAIPQMSSTLGQAAERDWFRSAARSICLSLK